MQPADIDVLVARAQASMQRMDGADLNNPEKISHILDEAHQVQADMAAALGTIRQRLIAGESDL